MGLPALFTPGKRREAFAWTALLFSLAGFIGGAIAAASNIISATTYNHSTGTTSKWVPTAIGFISCMVCFIGALRVFLETRPMKLSLQKTINLWATLGLTICVACCSFALIVCCAVLNWKDCISTVVILFIAALVNIACYVCALIALHNPQKMLRTDESVALLDINMPNTQHKIWREMSIAEMVGNVIITIIVVFFVVILGSFTVTTAVRAADAKAILPLGRMYDVPVSGDVYQQTLPMHMSCIGNSSANMTFVLLHDHDTCAASLAPLQEELARYNNRVCIYDRAGYGWSSRGYNTITTQTHAKHLTLLMKISGESTQCVLVGHGDGAKVAMAFRKYTPGRVKGMVFVDTNVFGEVEKRVAALKGTDYEADRERELARLSRLRMFSPLGISTDVPDGGAEVFGDAYAGLKYNYRQPQQWNSRYWDMYQLVKDTDDTGYDSNFFDSVPNGELGTVPLLVLTSHPDTTNETCSSLGFEEADGTKECELARKVSYTHHITALVTSKMSARSQLETCPPPCGHTMAWDHKEWIAERINEFVSATVTV